MGEISSIEDVVLEHEEDVKEDGEETETKLGRVAKDARPVVVVVSDQDHLNDGETSASEVEEYISNTPADSAFPSEVHIRLRNILYDCDPQFDVGEVVEHVQPGDDADSGQDEGDRDEDGDAQQDRQAPLRHLLVAPLEDEALKDGDGGGKDCMDGKEDVRRCDWKNSSRVLRVIFSLYGVDPEEGDVEASVEGEPDQVEGEKVKVEADHAFPPEVFHNLRPE